MHHPSREAAPAEQPLEAVEEVEIRGHIIDSLLLPKILDLITGNGGSFRINKISIGQGCVEQSGMAALYHPTRDRKVCPFNKFTR